MPANLTIACPAKLNLALAVAPPLGPAAGPKRGYHPICSWFAAIGLADDLTLEALPVGTESRYAITWAPDAPRPSPIDWPIDQDLAVRAHRLVEQHARRALPVAMTLRKRTPVGGGLGGGSSDAAGMIRGLDALFALGLSAPHQHALAATLGSDIAFFLDHAASIDAPPRPALVTGLGEELRRLERVPAWAVLIIPAFGCPTGPVYKAFDADFPPRFRQDEVFALVESAIARGRIDSRALFNDLARPAEAVAPALAGLRRDAALAAAAPLHVTGSGSTLFALADSPATAADLAARLAPLPAATIIAPLL